MCWKRIFNDVLHVQKTKLMCMQCFRIYLKIYKYCTSYYSGQKTYQGHDVKRKKYLVLFNFNFGDFAHFRGNTKKIRSSNN